MWVVISSDTKKHAELLPLALAGWRKLFPEVRRAVVMVTDDMAERDRMRALYGEFCDSLTFLNTVPDVPLPNACKLARLWTACQFGDEVVTLEDADLIPLNADFRNAKWEQRAPGEILLVGQEVYNEEKRIAGRIPMSQVTAESNALRKIAGVDCGFQSFCERFKGVSVNGPDEDPYNSPEMFSDEALFRVLLDGYRGPTRYVARGYKWPDDVIDRACWKINWNKLTAGQYIEAHLLKPLYHHVHRQQMAPLMRFLGVEGWYARHDAETPGARRVLIMQSGGEHEANRHMRESLSLQNAIREVDRHAVVDVCGPRQEKAFEEINLDTYDTIVVVEQYEDRALPDLSRHTQTKVYWSIDSHKAYPKHMSYCKANDIDIVLCAVRPDVAKFLADGLNAHWFPNCADARWFWRGGDRPHADRGISLGFCGHMGNRGQLIADLGEFCGLVASQKYGDAYPAELQNTRIEWNCNEADDINYRTVEAALAGCCVVTNETSGIRDMFVPGEEIILYDAPDGPGLTETVQGLLRDPERVARVGAAGRARAGRDHTYEARARTLLHMTAGGARRHGEIAGATIALNMIVGPGEAVELERCLSSFKARDRFDQVVIGLTTGDESVETVAKTYATKIVRCPWATPDYPHGHFGRARQTVLDATTTDYVMWLDADDVLLPKYAERFEMLLQLIRECDKKIDVCFIPYYTIVNLAGDPEASFLKERIWKRCDLFHWQYPVHELIYDYGAWEDGIMLKAVANNIAVVHENMKPPQASAVRNVRILGALYDDGDRSEHVLYFLGQELMVLGELDRAAEMYKELINRLSTSPENLYMCCLNIAFWKLYGQLALRPRLDEAKDVDEAESWVRLAIGFRDVYAEPWVMLGDIYNRRGLTRQAMAMYRRALGKRYNTGVFQVKSYYEEVPASRLADIYEAMGETEQALWYNKRARVHARVQDYLDQRQRLVGKLTTENT